MPLNFSFSSLYYKQNKVSAQSTGSPWVSSMCTYLLNCTCHLIIKLHSRPNYFIIAFTLWVPLPVGAQVTSEAENRAPGTRVDTGG